MSLTETSLNRSGTAAIDSSIKAPALVYLISGAKWLFLASILGYMASWKLHNPEFLNSCSFLTVGRVQAAYTTALFYGFGCNFAFAVSLWLIARTSGTAISNGLALIIASIVWNIALTVGLVGIFMGHLNAFELLELPSYVGTPLFLSSLVVSVWGILCFKNRSHTDVYASQWYLILAFLAFPWIQMVAKIMLFVNPAPGVVQTLVASWFASNLLWLWFGAIAVATLYYLIPKILNTQIASYNIAYLGFLTLVFAGTWTGAASVVGGPFPAWIITTGITASLLMVIFFVITGINFVGTLRQNGSDVDDNGTLLFVKFSAYAILVSGLGAALLSLRGVAEVTQFTILLDAHRFLIFYGGFSMAMFAAVYHFLPKLLGRAWPMEFMISSHFWISFVAIIMLVVPLTLGGWKQGSAMLDATIPFAEVVKNTSYFMVARSMAWIFLTIGHLGFIMHLIVMLKPDCDACLEDLTHIDSEPAEGGAQS